MKTLWEVLMELGKTLLGALVFVVMLWAGGALAAIAWTILKAGWQFGLGPT